jgi:hypothetical protein
MQLAGPVPEALYHRYVEFRPFIAGMFTSHSLRGRLLNRALHHQHARIYNYDGSTVYGIFKSPSVDMTKKFLDFVHYDQGGRIFAYVLTLDAQWRFTETGKEFGIDMLSKHTMHSDVSQYIAYSGEFFIRRMKHPHQDQEKGPNPSFIVLPLVPDPDQEAELHNDDKPTSVASAESPKDPSMYELIIDNASGTYRPNAKYLHVLKEFMAKNLPGLRVVPLDCQGDKELMMKLKSEQRERKKKANKKGGKMMYMQNDSSWSSISSSDEEQLNERAEGRE